MNRTMVIGPQPACWWVIVWRPGGDDKAQRRRWEGAICRQADDRWQGTIGRALAAVDAACRPRAIYERLRIAINALGTVESRSMPVRNAPHPPNRRLLHGDPYRGIPSP